MYDESVSIIEVAIGKFLKTEIKFVSSVYVKVFSKVNEVKDEKRTICIGLENIYFFSENFNELLQTISFESLNNIVFTEENPRLLKIIYQPFGEVILTIRQRKKLIEKLTSYYMIYYMEKKSIINELKVIKNNKIFANLEGKDKQKKKNEDLFDQIFTRCPENCVIHEYKGYMFFQYSCLKELGNGKFRVVDKNAKGKMLESMDDVDKDKIDDFEEKKEFFEKVDPEKLKKKYENLLVIKIGDKKPIEFFQTNPNRQDIGFEASRIFLKFVNLENNWGYNYRILRNYSYGKKFNLSKDTASWEGWKIEARTSDLNIHFFLLRRKYIPPFYDSFCDIVVIYTERLDNKNVQFIAMDTVIMIENIVDSIFPNEDINNPKDLEPILDAKIDSLVLDSKSLNYMHNVLNITSRDSYKIGLQFVFKLILMLEEFSKDFIKPVKDVLSEKIIKEMKRHGVKDFSIKNYENVIKDKNIKVCIKEFDSCNKNLKNDEEQKFSKILWEKKVYSYIFFCVDGGLTSNMFQMNDVVDLFRKNDELRKHYSLINDMLYFVVIDKKNQVMDNPTINNITNRLQTITKFEYNEELLYILISNEFLKEVQNVDDNQTYANFLKYLIEQKQTNQLMVSIYQYLSLLSKSDSYDEAMKNLAMIKALAVIIEPLIRLYTKIDQVPVSINLACKSLICLTNHTAYAKESINYLLKYGIFHVIIKYLDYPYEKVVFNTLSLLYNVLPSTKEIIDKILEENPVLINKLISLLKNNNKNIPLTYCSTRIFIKLLGILKIIVEMQNSGLKDSFTKLHVVSLDQSKSDSKQFEKLKEEHSDFFTTLINYLNSNTIVQPLGLEENIVIQKLVYDFLYTMMNKNQEFKTRIEAEFNLLKLLDIKSIKIIEVINKKLESKQIHNSEVFTQMINKFLIIVREIVGKDLEMMNKLKLYCNNIYSLIILITENKSKNDYVKNFEDNAHLLFNQLKNPVPKQRKANEDDNGDGDDFNEEEEEDDDGGEDDFYK